MELKGLTREAIPAALEKAHRYRLLNEPEQAESICADILAVEPENQAALTTLILALTDRFHGPRPASPKQARDLIPRLTSDYDREYYSGLVAEREGLAWLRSERPHSASAAYDCFRQAMACYERAEILRAFGNDDSVLRWNSCVRMIQSHADVGPRPEEAESSVSLED